MIECSCACDIDSEGAFERLEEAIGEYRTCTECGATIWPWEKHTVGLWWDCGLCEVWDDDCGCDEGCQNDAEPTQIAYMCGACTSACDQLLCSCWYFGHNWERIADENNMSIAECIG